ncbi:hypothetical protein ACWEJ6_10410 [Nonomuraea sp. NPDC004702]
MGTARTADCHGSWQAVYNLFRRRQRARAWHRILTHLQTNSVIGRIRLTPC